MKRRRKRQLWISALVFFISMFALIGGVEATDGIRGDECVVEADEVIVEDFYFLCNTLVIYGFVQGDLIGIASEVTIADEGQVMGDIWFAGGQLTIEGVVGDDLHFLGADLDITSLARFPDAATDITSGAISMEIADPVVIPGDIIFYGYQAIIEGSVNGNLDFQGQSLIIHNAIAGHVEATVGDREATAPLSTFPLLYSIDFRDPGLYFTYEDSDLQGYINGDLQYDAPQRVRTLDHVGGRTQYRQSVQTSITEAEQSETFLQIMGNYLLVTAQEVAALSFIGILVLNFFSPLVIEPSYRVQRNPVSAFSWGLMFTLFAMPASLLMILASLLILLIVAVLTLNELTAMVGILLLVINLGIMGGFFFLLAFLGRAITSFVIGYLMLRAVQRIWAHFGNGTTPNVISELWFSVVVGVLVVSLIVHLPLGAVVGIVQLILTGVLAAAGLGALFMYFRDLWYLSERDFSLNPDLDLSQGAPPPPMDEDFAEDIPLGMRNLPPGFTGFDED